MDEITVRNWLLRHTKDVFATMLGLEVSEAPGVGERTPEEREGLVALIGFSGAYTGNCMVNCSRSLACKLASSMLLEEYQAVNGEVMDALGEISNMIFGNVKSDLEEHLGPLQLSLPSVVAGQNLSVRSLANPSWIVMPLTMGGEVFEACICISSATKKSQGSITRESEMVVA